MRFRRYTIASYRLLAKDHKPLYMKKPMDERLAPYAEQLRQIVSTHTELAREIEESRAIFNADFKKVMQQRIRPAVQELLDTATAKGHWVDIHATCERRFLAFVHQCYTIHWTTGGTSILSVVANYDYRKVFFIVEHAQSTAQNAIPMEQIREDSLSQWLYSAFPTL